VVADAGAEASGDPPPGSPLDRCSSPAADSLVLGWLLAALTAAEAESVASLHQLNGEAVRAFARCDTSWCREYLSDDFVCTLADGRRVDKTRLLRETEARRLIENITCDEVDVRAFGQLGVVHGVAHCAGIDSPTSTRFTHVWLVRDGRWRLIAAQLTRVVPSASSRIL
jgi:ketosteroid isomerase-like protein